MNHLLEVELIKKKTELDSLLKVYHEKEGCFNELNRDIFEFKYRYSSRVAQKQLELNSLNAQFADFIIKKLPTETHSQHNNSNFETIDDNADQGYKEIKIDPPLESLPLHNAKELKKTYRKIASIIHPDKAKDERSLQHRTKLMVELNDAYAQKNINKMRFIHDQWRNSPDAVTGEGVTAELERTQREITNMKRMILTLDKEISALIASDIYAMMKKVNEAKTAGRDIIDEMSESLNHKIKDAQNKLFMRMFG